jgi:hypothetical protein
MPSRKLSGKVEGLQALIVRTSRARVRKRAYAAVASLLERLKVVGAEGPVDDRVNTPRLGIAIRLFGERCYLSVTERTRRRYIESERDRREGMADYTFDPTGDFYVNVSFAVSPMVRVLVPATQATDASICEALRPLVQHAWEEHHTAERQRVAAERANRRDAAREALEKLGQRRYETLIAGTAAWVWYERCRTFVRTVAKASRTYRPRRRRLAEGWINWATSYLDAVNPINRMFNRSWREHAEEWLDEVPSGSMVFALDR